MPMTQEAFEALLARLERQASKRPGAYRARLALLAGLGYAYIALALLLLVAALIGVLLLLRGSGASVVVAIGALIVAILRSLWVRIPKPEGIALRRAQVPALFRVIDETVSALRAPCPGEVLLTEEFSAAVWHRPRLGVLGWPQSYLMLGLPLMLALSPEQFRAVLAHELGHVSGRHGSLGVWTYRVRQTWGQLLAALEARRSWGAVVFGWFLRWYAPLFDAYAFVVVRAHEYAADRYAAEVTNPEALAAALVNLGVKGRFLSEKLWPSILRQADDSPEPPPDPIASVAGALQGGPAAEDAARWLEAALSEKTATSDTHPSLSQRLAALGQPAAGGPGDVAAAYVPVLAPPAVTAADQFLGPARAALEAQLQSAWVEGMRASWAERYQYVQQARARLAELYAKAEGQPLGPDEAWEQARLVLELRGNEEALPLLRAVVAAQPNHPEANFALGRLLLEEGDATGIEHIERAMAVAPEAVLSGCGLIYAYLAQRGRGEEADKYRQRAVDHAEALERAEQERSRITRKDQFLPPDLPAATLEDLRRQLAEQKEIVEGYLVRKAVTLFPERPCYVLGLVIQRAWYSFTTERRDAAVVGRLLQRLQFDGHCVVLVLNDARNANGWLRKPIRRVPGSAIYRRSPS